MKIGPKSILWSGLLLLAMLSIVVPLLNFITVTLMMVPYVILYTTLSRRAFALHVLPVWLIAYLILGEAPLIIGLFFLIPSLVMGHLYRKQAPALKILASSMIAFLAQLLAILFTLEVVLKLSLIRGMRDLVRETSADMQAKGLLPAGWNSDYTEEMIRLMTQSIPLTLIAMSFFYIVIAHYVSRRMLRRQGVAVPGLPEAKDWRVPRIMVLYYLIIMVLDFIAANDQSFMTTAVVNLLPLIRFVFQVQAVGFMFFLAHERGWNKSIAVLMSIPVLLFPPLSLLGLFDAIFPIRRALKKS
ncbi:DUF2232 domain-containing protein [Paenibacillus sp. GCM10023252]|uniref:DUF2232 domain-containing protein n=1 Tax=Paenibacillus sp. GCM10023252 TaxID=3252649 RepID=UPI003611FB57